MKKLIAVASSMILGLGTAFAGDMEKEQTFGDLDQNKDGVLTQEEASADQYLVARFVEFDVNQDGVLTSNEFDLAHEESEEAE